MKFDSKNIRGVFFDLDDTLYDLGDSHVVAQTALLNFLSEKLGIPYSEAEEAYLRARDTNQKSLGSGASAYSRLLYIQKCIEFLKGKTELRISLEGEDIFWKALVGAITLREGAMNFMLDLKSRGIKTAVVTNLITQAQMKKMVQLGLDGVCDILVTSEEAGEGKPGAKPFLLALEKLKLTPGEVVMVGDNYDADIVGPRNLGMRAVYLLTGRNSDPSDSDTVVARNFAEIKAFFTK